MRVKKRKTKTVQISHEQEVNVESKNILRTLNPNESFHFYEAIGKPTGQNASSLPEFLDKVKFIKTESLKFHLERKDFQNWIHKTLGDTTLAARIAKTNTKHEDKMRAQIQSTLERRIKELAGPSLAMAANTEQTATRRQIPTQGSPFA